LRLSPPQIGAQRFRQPFRALVLAFHGNALCRAARALTISHAFAHRRASPKRAVLP
jgi:hypothetical protein